MATKSSKTRKQPAKPAVKPAAKSAVRAAAPKAAAPALAKPQSPPAAPKPVSGGKFSPEERHHMIAEAAYYLALRRGPASDPMKNWLEAERDIDARLR